MTENEIGTLVVESAMAVHRGLGPGLLETVYEVVLARELQQRGLRVERQVAVPIEYQGIRFPEGFRADMIVENKVILELKSIEHVTRAHKKQLLTYLRLTRCRLGYLLNFGEALMKDGITRCVNGLCAKALSLRLRASARVFCRAGTLTMTANRHTGGQAIIVARVENGGSKRNSSDTTDQVLPALFETLLLVLDVRW